MTLHCPLLSNNIMVRWDNAGKPIYLLLDPNKQLDKTRFLSCVDIFPCVVLENYHCFEIVELHLLNDQCHLIDQQLIMNIPDLDYEEREPHVTPASGLSYTHCSSTSEHPSPCLRKTGHSAGLDHVDRVCIVGVYLCSSGNRTCLQPGRRAL